MTRYEDDYDRDMDEEDFLIDGVGFADPGGESALRAATKDNPRNLPCGTCGWPNRLTPIDVARGYQCDSCADTITTGRDIDYYEEEKSGDPEYKYSIVILVQVEVTATSSEVAMEKATSSHSNWDDWSVVDSPSQTSPEIINVDP